MGQFAPDVEEQGVAVAPRERGESGEQLGIELAWRGRVRFSRVRRGATEELELATLLATVAGDRSGRDAEQPRPGAATELRVEPCALSERGDERLLREILRDVGTDAAGEEADHRVEVAFDDGVEALRGSRKVHGVG